jgi:hypothetical protein
MPTHNFQAILIRPDSPGSWTYLNVPFSIEAAFGSKGQVKVRGTVNGQPFRGSVMPHGDGTHFLVVNKAIRDAAGVTTGDTVSVSMEQDSGERVVNIPDDLRAMLDADEAARTAFEKFSYSHQKEYVDWIESAKTAETRQRRIESAAGKIAQRERLKK